MLNEVTNTLRKRVKSLCDNARARRDEQLFVAQGVRCVGEMAGYFKCEYLIATQAFAEANHALADKAGVPFTIARRADIERMSSLSTPPDVLAVLRMARQPEMISIDAGSLYIALDNVRDPGNLGTIIRLADWFGIKGVICSRGCADVYSPKVVQSTMGALCRVPVLYTDNLAQLLAEAAIPVYGTHLHGDDIYSAPLTPGGIIVMGNEANGLSDEVSAVVDHRLFIPPYPADAESVESLNVAVATAVTVAEFRRRVSR